MYESLLEVLRLSPPESNQPDQLVQDRTVVRSCNGPFDLLETSLPSSRGEIRK